MNPLIPAAEAALQELQRLHGTFCAGGIHCPTAAVIRLLTTEIAACKVAELGEDWQFEADLPNGGVCQVDRNSGRRRYLFLKGAVPKHYQVAMEATMKALGNGEPIVFDGPVQALERPDLENNNQRKEQIEHELKRCIPQQVPESQ